MAKAASPPPSAGVSWSRVQLSRCGRRVSIWTWREATGSIGPSTKRSITFWAARRADHPRRIRQLRLPLLPRRQRADRRGSRPVRRPAALCLPPQAAGRQPPRPPGRRTRRAGPRRRELLGAHVKLMTRSEVLTEDDLSRWRWTSGCETATRPTTRRGRARQGAGRRRRSERAGERRADHADLLHQRPPLRRAVGRERLRRRDARHARSPGPLGGARLRELGPVGRRPAAARDASRHRARRTAAWRRRSPRSGSSELGFAFGGLSFAHVASALDQRRPADDLLSGRRSRDQARVHGRAPRRLAFRGVAGRRRPRRHDRAGACSICWSSRRDRGRTAGACRCRPTPPSPSR